MCRLPGPATGILAYAVNLEDAAATEAADPPNDFFRVRMVGDRASERPARVRLGAVRARRFTHP